MLETFSPKVSWWGQTYHRPVIKFFEGFLYIFILKIRHKMLLSTENNLNGRCIGSQIIAEETRKYLNNNRWMFFQPCGSKANYRTEFSLLILNFGAEIVGKNVTESCVILSLAFRMTKDKLDRQNLPFSSIIVDKLYKKCHTKKLKNWILLSSRKDRWKNVLVGLG